MKISIRAALAVGLGATAIIWAVFQWHHTPEHSVAESSKSVPTAKSTASAPSQTAAQPPATSAAYEPKEVASSSKSGEYEALLNEGSPDAKFRAYMLAQACVWAMEAEHSAEMAAPGQRTAQDKAMLESGELKAKKKSACGDLKDQQLFDRTKYLAEAAEAGVATAALRLSAEGPFGDPTALTSRPNDPAVLEWRRHVVDLLKLAAQKGDVAAMASLSNMYSSGTGIVQGRDPVKALEYATAMWDAQQKATGKRSSFAEQRTKELSEGLTVEQVEAAKKAGHTLAMGGDK